VKVNGFRIELGEIETVLARHPLVADAVVVAWGEGAQAELAAYVVPRGGVAGYELRQFVAEKLPAYMVPSTVTLVGVFPLTPNGKVDRKALPEPVRVRSSERELVGPRTGLERRLVEIWQRELGVDRVGVTDNFFDLGVRSIVAASLFASIEREVGDRLPLGAIFRAPTIEQLARLIEGEQDGSRWTSLVPIAPEGSEPPLFCVHGGAGTILMLASLAPRFGADQPVYGLQARGLYGKVAPLRTIEEMASHYLSEMRDVHPPGRPWRITGYCFGAIVAYEIAQQLTAAGEQVQLLASFNGPSPIWIKRWVWYGNQPSQRAKHPPKPKLTRGQRIGRLLREPHRLKTFFGRMWALPYTRFALRTGRPIPERVRESYFFKLHHIAEVTYEPKPYPGEMLIFYGDGLYDDPELGWSGLAEGGIHAFGVPDAEHDNRQAMREPGASFMAGHIREYLASAAR
jgi:acyl carrier protein